MNHASHVSHATMQVMLRISNGLSMPKWAQVT